MKKKKQKQENKFNIDVEVGTEIVIISELLKDFENDFVYEERSTFFDGGIEFKIIKVISAKEASEISADESNNN